jgi:acetyl esterase/lipase
MLKNNQFGLITLFIAMIACVLVVPGAGASDDPVSATASDKPPVGTINMPAFSYPPSSLSSEEQRRAYERSLAMPGNGTISMPTDPKLVATVRAFIEDHFKPSIAYMQERYPVDMTTETIAGVEVIRVRPKGGIPKKNRKRILVDVHGGAFMVGWPSMALLDAIPVASLSGIEVVTINYRMFPEVVHPAALEDLTKVYQEILKTHDPRNVGVFGGSGGGILTLQSIPWFKEHGIPLPAAIGALACGFREAIGDSSIWNFNGSISKPGTTLIESGGYFGNAKRTDWAPGTSADKLDYYPPTLWVAGTRAPEMSGAISGHASMLKHGVQSELYMIEGGWHSSYSTAPDTPESQDAMRYVAHFFDKRLGR